MKNYQVINKNMKTKQTINIKNMEQKNRKQTKTMTT